MFATAYLAIYFRKPIVITKGREWSGHVLFRVAKNKQTWWVSFAPEFLCCYFCESSCLFYLSFNFDFYVSKIMHL